MTTSNINSSDLISAITGLQMQAQSNVIASLGSTAAAAGSSSFQSILDISASKNSNSGSPDNNLKKNNISKLDISNSDNQNVQNNESSIKDVIKSSVAEENSQTVSSNTEEAVIDDIKNIVKDKLNLTDEELEKMLSELGITVQDLVYPQNVALLVAKYNETDVTSIITDDTMTQMLTKITSEITNTIQQAADSLNISVEEFTQMVEAYESTDVLETAKETPEYNLQNTQDNSSNIDDKADKSDVKQILMESTVITDESTGKEIRVTVKSDQISGTAIETQTEVVNTEQSEADAYSQNNGTDSDSNNSKNSEDTANNILNNLSGSVQNRMVNSTHFEQSFSANPTFAADVIEQMIDAVKVNVTADFQSMEIQLTPENLGKVNLNVVLREGILTATITAQNEAVKNVIDSQIVQLRESLSSQGLKVEAVEVTVENQSFDANAQNDNSSDERNNSQTRRSRNFKGIDEIPEDETLNNISEENILDINGSSVSYTA